MASTYPGSLDSFATNRSDATVLPTTHAADHNNVNDALNKIEAELGVNPSASYASVNARVVAMEEAVAGAPGPSFPASYYTGPLGANNVLPNSETGALLILWHEIEGQTGTQRRASLLQRMVDCGGRDLDCVGIHYGGIDSEIPGRGGSSMGSGAEAWAHSVGAIPCVSWVHNRYTKGTTNLCTMQEVNNGLHDAAITEAANYWEGLGYRIMWRLWWEFDGNWFPWSQRDSSALTGGNCNDGFPNPGCTFTEWKTAWQRCVSLVQAAGATNVGFWWAPTSWNNRTVSSACYPGDAYIDWVGADGYNQASATVQTSPLHAGWADFWELYNPTGHGTASVSIHNEFGPSKPFYVAETNTLYDSGTSTRKADWYRNINDHAFAKPDMPYFYGIQLFDNDLHSTEGFDWRVDVNQTYAQKQTNTQGAFHAVTYQGFKDFAAHADWNVGAIGGAT